MRTAAPVVAEAAGRARANGADPAGEFRRRLEAINEQLGPWLEASCAAQGVPVRIEDRSTLRQVATLVGDAIGGGCTARAT
ncbi:MAG TPA: hypothetical protein VGA20_09375 [Gemmatimonadales bacterium]